MSPFSRPVLLPSVVLASPVLLDAYGGAVTWTDALYRFLLVQGICWLAVSVVHALAFSPSHDARVALPGDSGVAPDEDARASASPAADDVGDSQRPPGP